MWPNLFTTTFKSVQPIESIWSKCSFSASLFPTYNTNTQTHTLSPSFIAFTHIYVSSKNCSTYTIVGIGAIRSRQVKLSTWVLGKTATRSRLFYWICPLTSISLNVYSHSVITRLPLELCWLFVIQIQFRFSRHTLSTSVKPLRPRRLFSLKHLLWNYWRQIIWRLYWD